MKLLVDCTPLRSGGGVQAAIAFLHGLANRSDVEWRAVAPSAMEELITLPTGVVERRVVFLPKQTAFDKLRARRRLRSLEHEFSPDVVFTVFGPSYFLSEAPHVVGFALPHLLYDDLRPSRWANIKSVLSRAFQTGMLFRADHLVVETHTVRSRLVSRFGLNPNNISVIENAVNPLLLEYSREILPDNERHCILVPSAYYRHKNLEVVPAVAEALKALDPTLNFVFQFTLESSSPEWRALEQDAMQRGVGNEIETTGVLPLVELAAAYQRASFVFLPTLRECSTAVYPESFYFRRPLITSDLDFARELCGDAALYVPPQDPNLISIAILQLIQDDAFAAQLVARGDKRLAQAYPSPELKFHQQITTLTHVAAARAASK